MIAGNTINDKHLNIGEKAYRALPYDSYSTVKDFLKSRLFYYKKYILGEKMDEGKDQEKEDMRFGSLVDCLKFSPETFDERYQVSLVGPPDSPQMLKFVNYLHQLCLKNSNDHGDIPNLEGLIEEAYLLTEIKRDSLEKWKEKFLVNREGYDYFLELKERGSRVVISSEELEWANSIVDYINQHPNISELMTKETDEQFEVIDQLQLEGEINGRRVKGMLDRTIIDKIAKTIQPIDLKVMSNNEIFAYNYLKLKYYIQNAMYTTLLQQNFPDFTILPFKFCAIHKYKQNDPIIINTTKKHYTDAMNGFTLNGWRYKGLLETIDELNWNINNNIWTTSQKIFESGGVINLELGGELVEE